ncbi:MAG: nucleotidyltransferase family protein [Candidatus Howiella sp.]|jgi:hypothetical protein
MDAEKRYFLSLMEAFLWERPTPERPPEVLLEEIVRLARLHSVEGIVGYMMRRLPPQSRPDATMQKYFGDAFFSTIKRMTGAVHRAGHMMEALSAAGLSHICLKGYVVRTCYPVPELRTFGDIDLFLKREDLEPACRVAEGMGYAVSRANALECTARRGEEYYEFHAQMVETEVSDAIDLTAYFSDIWQYVVPLAGEYTYTLGAERHLLYLFVHLAKHLCYGGAGVRMFLDIAAFMKTHENLDWTVLKAELEKTGLSRFADRVLFFCREWLGLQPPIPVDDMPEEEAEAFLNYVLAGGAFGALDAKAPEIMLRRSMHVDGDAGGAVRRARLRVLFPSYERMRAAYPFIDGRKYLLPVAWGRRALCVFSPKRRAVARQMRGLSQAADDRLLAQRRLFDSLGLK